MKVSDHVPNLCYTLNSRIDGQFVIDRAFKIFGATVASFPLRTHSCLLFFVARGEGLPKCVETSNVDGLRFLCDAINVRMNDRRKKRVICIGFFSETPVGFLSRKPSDIL